MKRLNQTESPILVILCVLCFQRQSFLTFISCKLFPLETMQIVSFGDNLQEMSEHIFWKKIEKWKKIENYFRMWCAEYFTQYADC